MGQADSEDCPPLKTVYRLGPRGLCAGVIRAIGTVEMALQVCGPPIYVLHAIVHNQYVLEDLASKGAVFVESLTEVPERATLVFSAHGVPPQVRDQARAGKFQVIDATCPLVAKVHVEAIGFAHRGYAILLIGDRGHDEIQGTFGHAPNVTQVISTLQEAEDVIVADPTRVAYLTQTTLSQQDASDIIACLKRRFPGIHGPATSDICYATQNRQGAVQATILAHQIELMLVVGSNTSANSSRLVQIAHRMGVSSYLIESADSIEKSWLELVHRVALTAGASVPDILVDRAIARLEDFGFSNLQDVNFVEEDVHFNLPSQLVSLCATSPPTTRPEKKLFAMGSGN